MAPLNPLEQLAYDRLCREPGQPVSMEELMDDLSLSPIGVRQVVYALRRKRGKSAIQTVWGFGYCANVCQTAPPAGRRVVVIDGETWIGVK